MSVAMVAVRFASKTPHATNWLEIAAPVSTPLDALLADLADAGWDHAEQPAPPYPGTRVEDDPTALLGFRHIPLGYDIKEITVFAPGSGLFGGWTPDERAEHMAAAMRVLTGYGFADVPTDELGITDLI